ncbi:hypothetical protein [Bacillus sp. Marseille-P3800]|uniref:hypothetical protein n=1 Tax=Bacillus sp. Marseille-P3800 TaxID=2014782 RepID=UPI000C0896B3|nr:hypothetical protein [Bacillus sp. Marseille-P3800]
MSKKESNEQDKPRRFRGALVYLWDYKVIYNILSILNLLWAVGRLIAQSFWDDVFTAVTVNEPSLDAITTYMLQQSSFQIIIVHTLVQIFLGIMLLLLPVFYLKINKLVLFGGTTIETETKVLSESSVVISKFQYLNTRLSPIILNSNYQRATDIDTLSSFATKVFEQCQDDLYSKLGRQLKLNIYDDKEEIAKLPKKTIEAFNIAKNNGYEDRPVSSLGEKQRLKHKLYLYRETTVTYSEPIYVEILSEEAIDNADLVLLNGLFDYAVLTMDYATLAIEVKANKQVETS